MIKKQKPTNALERNEAGNILRRMIEEMEVEDLYIGFEDSLFYLEWGLLDEFDFASGLTLDDAYVKARHKVAGAEPPPF